MSLVISTVYVYELNIGDPVVQYFRIQFTQIETKLILVISSSLLICFKSKMYT